MSDYEPDFDDINGVMADEEDNAPPSEPLDDVTESFHRAWMQAINGETKPIEQLWDGMDDDDDLCPECGEPLDFCVCNTDDELDEFD